MIQLIAFITFLISVALIMFILCRKIPALVKLPQHGHVGLKKPEFILKIEKTIKDAHFHFFKKQMILHKLLSKTRLWVLRTERKIDVLLHGIRKKAQELDKKNEEK